MAFVEITQNGYDLQGVNKRFEKGIRAGTTAVGKAFYRTSGLGIENIYNWSIPRSRTGRPLWKRTGALRRGRSLQFSSNWDRALIYIRGRAATAIRNYDGGYAQRRHQLAQSTNEFGKGWIPHSPAGGVYRGNPFFEASMQTTGPRVELIFGSNFEKAL